MNPQTETNGLIRELQARIDWRIKFSEIIFDEPPYLVMQPIPQFPGSEPKLDELGIVWDIFALLESAKRPDAYQILTGDCGYAPDVYLAQWERSYNLMTYNNSLI